MGKGICSVYKHIQNNWTYLYHNTTFVVPLLSYLSPQIYFNNYCSATIIACNQTLPVSKLTTTNQVDTDINNDDDICSFETPTKQNCRTPEIHDTITSTNLVQHDVHFRLYQLSPSILTTSLKLNLSGKGYLCFQIYGVTSRIEQCETSISLTKVIYLILDIE